MTELSRAQLQAWEGSLQLGDATLVDTRAGCARLRGRLRHALSCLREALESTRRLADLNVRTRAELRLEQDRLAALITRIPAAYLLTSEDGTIQQANPAACLALGVSARALVGRNVLIFLDDRDMWRQLLTQTLAPGGGVQRVARVRPRERLQVAMTVDLCRVDMADGPAVQWLLTNPPPHVFPARNRARRTHPEPTQTTLHNSRGLRIANPPAFDGSCPHDDL